jgi:hypothetical protein
MAEIKRVNLSNMEDSHFNPAKNGNAISIVEQPDGNWKGWMVRFGSIMEVRDVSPDVVLQRLLTSSGTE